jgi:hypothetical protein
MAKKGNALNKSAAIRDALAQYPGEGPASIARILSRKHGIPFDAKHVSTIKANLHKPSARTAAPVAARRTPAVPVRAVQPAANGATALPASEGVAAMVANLQAYIRGIGKAELHQLIDAL